MSFWEAIKARSLAATWTANQTAILNLAQTIGIIGGLMFTIWSFHAESNGRSADFMLRFSQMLDSGDSGLVAAELDENENLNKFALKGRDSDDAIDEFLSNYELLNTAYQDHLIDKNMALDAFSWELEIALNDPAIRQYISFSMTQSSDMFDGVIELAQAWKIKFPPITPAKDTSISASPP